MRLFDQISEMKAKRSYFEIKEQLNKVTHDLNEKLEEMHEYATTLPKGDDNMRRRSEASEFNTEKFDEKIENLNNEIDAFKRKYPHKIEKWDAEWSKKNETNSASPPNPNSPKSGR